MISVAYRLLLREVAHSQETFRYRLFKSKVFVDFSDENGCPFEKEFLISGFISAFPLLPTGQTLLLDLRCPGYSFLLYSLSLQARLPFHRPDILRFSLLRTSFMVPTEFSSLQKSPS